MGGEIGGKLVELDGIFLFLLAYFILQLLFLMRTPTTKVGLVEGALSRCVAVLCYATEPNKDRDVNHRIICVSL